MAAKFFRRETSSDLSRRFQVRGENVFEVLVLLFDGFHGGVDGLADVGGFGKLEEGGETGVVGQIEDALSLVVGFADFAAAGGLGGEFRLGEGEFVVGVAEEDEAEDGDGVFGGFEFGVGAEFVGGAPEAFFEFGGVGGHRVLDGFAFKPPGRTV